MTEKSKYRLALRIPAKFEDRRPYGETMHVEIGFAVIDDKDATHSLTYSLTYDYEAFEDLRFTTYASWREGKWEVHGFDLEYRDLYAVGLYKMETMVKLLRKAAKAYSSFPVRPETFGQYVQLMASALGVTHMMRMLKPEHPSRRDHGTEFRVYNLKDSGMSAQYLVDNLLYDLKQEKLPEPKPETSAV